jgi:hypothetical protein
LKQPWHPGHLFEIAGQALRALWKAPEKIRRFFDDPSLAYISQGDYSFIEISLVSIARLAGLAS